MKPIFTVEAGEYLVASFIEQHFKDLKVWLPSNDTGIDLLVTDRTNKRVVSLQVEFSKDFVVTHARSEFVPKLKCWAWWTIRTAELTRAEADLWVFVVHSFHENSMEYVVVPPAELCEKFRALDRNNELIQSYFWVTKSKKCWETWGLDNKELETICEARSTCNARDLTPYLNNWEPLTKRLRR